MSCASVARKPDPGDARATSPAAARVDELRAEARYRRQRADLYRAKSYGLHPVSPTRLRELEHAATAAEERLAHALEHPPPNC
jgi:hypothetical protein